MVDNKELKKLLRDAARKENLNLTFEEKNVILSTDEVKITLTEHGIWYAERKT